ncbi:UNVERIFIED_CONTAM: hypothetical protein Slati_3735700 [Sesamum latifolium]|uniref:Uncharacterized protein n=1 Tax=Sesamum latifolium TaxID=2727402 RepID=A0AAW2U2D0_9LAMI
MDANSKDEEYKNGVEDCTSNKDSQQWLTRSLMDKLRSLIASWYKGSKEGWNE